MRILDNTYLVLEFGAAVVQGHDLFVQLRLGQRAVLKHTRVHTTESRYMKHAQSL